LSSFAGLIRQLLLFPSLGWKFTLHDTFTQAQSRPVDASVKILQIIRAAMLASIVLYAVVAHMLLVPRPARDPMIFYIVELVAVMDVVAIVVLRRILVSRSVCVLATQPGDGKALAQWRAGYLLTYALSEAIALFGLVLNALGYTIRQSAPFYIAGFALILFFRPRPPANEIG
jgi:hypothetical protein